jgi:ankyrin repeat protein
VKLLLGTWRVDVNSKEPGGATPWWWAASEGLEEVVRLLLKPGKVEIDLVKDYDDGTPFLGAASNGHTSMVKLLLETGRVDIDSMEYYSWWRSIATTQGSREERNNLV